MWKWLGLGLAVALAAEGTDSGVLLPGGRQEPGEEFDGDPLEPPLPEPPTQRGLLVPSDGWVTTEIATDCSTVVSFSRLPVTSPDVEALYAPPYGATTAWWDVDCGDLVYKDAGRLLVRPFATVETVCFVLYDSTAGVRTEVEVKMLPRSAVFQVISNSVEVDIPETTTDEVTQLRSTDAQLYCSEVPPLTAGVGTSGGGESAQAVADVEWIEEKKVIRVLWNSSQCGNVHIIYKGVGGRRLITVHFVDTVVSLYWAVPSTAKSVEEAVYRSEADYIGWRRPSVVRVFVAATADTGSKQRHEMALSEYWGKATLLDTEVECLPRRGCCEATLEADGKLCLDWNLLDDGCIPGPGQHIATLTLQRSGGEELAIRYKPYAGANGDLTSLTNSRKHNGKPERVGGGKRRRGDNRRRSNMRRKKRAKANRWRRPLLKGGRHG